MTGVKSPKSGSSIWNYLGSLMSLIKKEDFVVTRIKTENYSLPLVGHPRRNAGDVWYTKSCPLGHDSGEFDPKTVHTPPCNDIPPLTHPLAPHYRACRLLGIKNTLGRQRVQAMCREKILSMRTL